MKPQQQDRDLVKKKVNIIRRLNATEIIIIKKSSSKNKMKFSQFVLLRV
jgi:hypothetical protein